MTDAQLAAIEAALTPEERTTLDELADAIARRGMVSPAMFFFESVIPLGIVAGTVMTFLRPLVGIVWRDPRRWAAVEKLLQERGAIEVMVRRLEARA